MSERPIIFSGESVRAILAGRKTVTRRLIKEPEWAVFPWPAGLRLWVKEALEQGSSAPGYRPGIKYSATMTGVPWRQEMLPQSHNYCGKALWPLNWTLDRPRQSPMFCPRWASRIELEVASSRAERLQAITEHEAELEGCREVDDIGAGGQAWARDVYLGAWDRLNPKAPAASNPLVWRIEFRVVESRGLA